MTTLAYTLPKRGRDGASLQALAGGIALALLVPLLALSGLAVPLPSAVYRLAVDLVERTEALSAGLTGGGSDSSSTRADTIRLRDDEPTVAARVATPSVSVPAGATSTRARKAAVLPGGKPETVSRRSGTPTSPRSGNPTSGTASVPPAVAEQPTPRPAPSPGGPTAETPTAGGGGGGGGASDSGGGQTPPPPGGPTPPPLGSSGSPQTPPATIGGTVGTVGETVGGTVGTVGETIGGPVGGTVGTVGETVETTVGSVGETVDETVATVEETVDTTVQTVGGLLGGLLPPKPPKK
jgi:hypothetical protein